MKKSSKILALALALIMLSAILLSVSIITRDAGHECVSNHCQVCQRMESAGQSLKGLTLVLLAMAIALAVVYAARRGTADPSHPSWQYTPVTLKVKLLN